MKAKGIRGAGGTKYFGVGKILVNGEPAYLARFDTSRDRRATKIFQDERKAAIAIDLHLIKLGKEPVNILKRKDNR